MGEAKQKRERPCHCGSGKQYAQCCMENDQAERYRGFVFGVEHDTVMDGFEIGPSGEVRVLANGKPAALADVRPTEWRKSGDELKTKSQGFTETSAFIGPEAAISSSAYVFGVDTNTITRGTITLNVSCLTCATLQSPDNHYGGTIEQIMCIDFRDDDYKAERVGWIIAIESAIRSGVQPSDIVTIVTDHDLAALPNINTGVEPIIPGYYLPKNFHMMYATDRGSALPNKLIKAAHKGASQVAKIVLDTGREGQLVLPSLLRQPGAEGISPWTNEKNSNRFFGA